MFEPSRVQKMSVIVVIGLFFGAGIVPTMNGNEIRITAHDNDTIGIDIATKVASAKLHELDKIDFSITESTEITNDKGESLFYVFNLNPQGYLVVSASYDLPPVIAYSFTSNFQDGTEANPLYDLLYADITLRLENIDIISEEHNQ